ncbi:MAG: RluA family pseudouridine synthase, partial [Dehalococcoidia bacterium]
PYRRRRMAISETGKEATTGYRVRKYVNSYTLVEVTPVTGRTHQIRVHLSAIGYPVVGDPVYGKRWPHLDRQFIHAYRLGFRLPSNGEYREFTSPLPADLERALDHLHRS